MTRRGNVLLGLAALAVVAIGIRWLVQRAQSGASAVPVAPLGGASPTASPTAYTSVYVYGGYRYFGDDAIL